MPKRSNAFQQVVNLLHEQFSDKCLVTESKLLPDSRTGVCREVDIVIESNFSEHSTVIGIECINHKRPASIEWIDQMSGKHAGLNTDKLVLISRSGFTPWARKQAAALNITTLALTEAKTLNWTNFIGKQADATIETLQTSYQGFIVVLSESGAGVLPAPRNLEIFSQSNATPLLFGHILESLVALPEIGRIFLMKMEQSKTTMENFSLDFSFTEKTSCIGPTGEILIIQSIRIVFSATREMVLVPLDHGAMHGVGLAYGEADAVGGLLRVAIVEQRGQNPVLEVKKQDGKKWNSLVNADLNTTGLIIETPEANF